MAIYDIHGNLPALEAVLADVSQAEAVLVCGHTHRQFDRTARGRRVVNAGSVGLPFKGRVGAFWAALGPTVELRCSDYDLEATRAWFDANGMPRSFARRLEFSLLEPADPDEVAEYFEGLATQAGGSV